MKNVPFLALTFGCYLSACRSTAAVEPVGEPSEHEGAVATAPAISVCSHLPHDNRNEADAAAF